MSDGKIIIDTDIDTTGATKGLSSLKSKISGGMSSISSLITKSVKAIAAAATAAGAGILKVGMDFEEAMSKVKAISGATAEEMELLTEKAKEMGFKTKYSATESAEAFYYMAQAGWKTEDMLNGIAGVMDLAAASGADLATTSDIVTDALTAFGMEASESARFADVLARASADTNTDVLKMGETFKYVGSIAGAMHYSIEDMGIAIGLMANSGVKASQAGTSLRSIITRMVNPTEDSAAAMEALGLSITDAEGNMKPFRTIMEEMRKSMQGLTEDQKVAYAGMLAGKPGMSGLLAILNATDEEFNNLANSIDNCNGAADEMARTMQDNLKGKIEQLGGAFESLGLSIYEKVQEPLKNLASKATDYVEQLNNAFTSGGFRGLADAIGQGLLQAIAEFNNKLPEFANKGAEILSNIMTGIQQNLPILTTTITNIVDTLIQKFFELLPQFVQLGISFLVQLGTGFANELPDLLNSMQNCVTQLGEVITMNLPNIINVGMKIIENLILGIQQNLPIMLTTAVEVINKLVEGITQALPSLIPIAINCVVTLANSIIDNLPTVIDAGIKLLESLVDGILDALPKLVDAVPKLIISFVNTIAENLPTIIEQGGNILLKLIDGIINNIPKLIDAIPKVITGIITGIANNLPKIIEQGILIIGKLVVGLIKAIPQIIAAIPQICDAIIKGFEDVDWSEVGKNIVIGIWNGIKALAGWLWNKAAEFAGGILDSVKSKLGIHSPSRLFRDEIGKFIPQGISVGIDKEMPELTKDTLSNLKDYYTKLQNAVNNSSLGTGIRSIGSNFVNNVINNPTPNIKNTIENVLNIDGREVARSISPYQSEFDNYALGR